jgi:hypothetical protein
MGVAASQSSVPGTDTEGMHLSQALQNEARRRLDLLSHLQKLWNALDRSRP